MQLRPSLSTSRPAVMLAVSALALAAGLGASAQTMPELGDPDFDPQIDLALECLADTRVSRFAADPQQVAPFAATTLAWDVDVPPGCPVRLSLAGRTIDAAGSLDVVPLHESSRFDLIARILGGTAVLDSVPVAVDVSGCNDDLAFEQEDLTILITPILEALDELDDDFEITGPPVVEVAPSGLSITLSLETFLNIDVTLEMVFRFTVRDGVVEPRYALFRPESDSVLPDDFVEGRFFDRADGILADFKTAVNSRAGALLPPDRKLFDIVLGDELTVVHCPFEPPPARLAVRLRLLPAGDPGRFNLRIDGVQRAGNVGNGGSTGTRVVAAGSHTVSQTAAAGTDLADYRTFIGGDCSPNGRVVVAAGETKACVITDIRQEDDTDCRNECRRERDLCMQDPTTPPEVCVRLFEVCLATCN